VTTPTSFKLDAASKSALAVLASREGLNATDMLKRLIAEGSAQAEFPGILFHSRGATRRAAIAGGPDVWEIINRVKQLDGDIEHRLAVVADETAVPVTMLRLAVDYYATHEAEITALIDDNHAAEQRVREVVKARTALAS
jgi:hypothetical protein